MSSPREQAQLSAERPGHLLYGGARMVLLDIEGGFWGLRQQLEALAGGRLADSVLQQAGANGGASFTCSFIGASRGAGAQAFRDCLAALQAAGFGRFRVEALSWADGRALIRGEDTVEAWMASRHGGQRHAPVCAYTAGVLVGLANETAGRRDVVCVERACRAQGARECVFELLPARDANGEPVAAFHPDPFLSHQLGLLEILFDRMPMGIAIFDRNLILRRCNPTWASFIERYTPRSAADVVPGAHLFDIAPGIEESAGALLQRALAGETVRREARQLLSGGMPSYWDVAWSPLIENGEVVGIVDVSADATERVLAQQELERRVEERTRQLATLLDVTHNITSTLELSPLLGLILEQLKEVVDYSAATVLSLDGSDLVVRAHRGPILQEEALKLRFPLAQAGANRTVIESREPAIIDDMFADEPLARAFRETAGDQLQTTYGYIRSWVGVPLLVKQRAIGMLTLDHSELHYYTPRRARLILAFANQAAVAIENARLYAEARRRIDESQTLFAVQQAINSRLDPAAVLQLVADEARRLTQAGRTLVFMREGEDLCAEVASGGDSSESMVGLRVSLAESFTGECVRTRRPLRVDDVRNNARLSREMADRMGVRSLLAVPLMLGPRAIGAIVAAADSVGAFDADDEWVLTVLASGAAIGLENARLYQEEQERRREAEQRRQVAEGLRDVLAILNSDRPLSEVLDYIMAQVGRLLGTDTVALYRLHEEDASLRIQAARGLAAAHFPGMTVAVGEGPVGRAVQEQRPVAACDVTAPPENGSAQAPQRAYYRSLLAVPLTVKDEVYGGIVLYYPEARELAPEEIALAAATADQAALAIENARLRDQVEQAAISAERSRLARDLHDAVTQTLFSASLIAEVLPRIWDRDAGQGRSRLEELRQLTRGALAEMRTLLLELRPTALVEAALGDLVRQLAEATTGRARVPVTVTVEGDGELPPDVQLALYRIVQVALNNVAKHSGATEARLSLRQTSDAATGTVSVELVVEDNGAGFDPEGVTSEHLGLGIMRERAQAIGAELVAASCPGEGTRITVNWRGAAPERQDE